jgi:RNA polymerase sigma-70 factor (ECF subfamily)
MKGVQENALRDELVRWIPNLRAFAMSLSQGAQQADDLVQDTLLKALANLDKFQAGTNMKAWLFTILRNSFYNDVRYQKYHQTAPIDDVAPASIQALATQDKYIEFKDVIKGMQALVPEQREAIILIAAEGLSYEEAAEICGCPVGTVKSRLSRARQRLTEYMHGEVKSPAEPVG